LFNKKGLLLALEIRLKKLERNSKYHYCKAQLEEHKPDFVLYKSKTFAGYCTSLAAQDLGIPTSTFIFFLGQFAKQQH
jgi:hypothetical protein